MQLMKGTEPGRSLEIGFGAGVFLLELERMGFESWGVEMNPACIERVVRLALDPKVMAARLHSDLASLEPNLAFDYLFAFEVLEHIKHDDQALERWLQHLKPEGFFLMSVPAHEAAWGPEDVWAGHYRRYEKRQLLDLLDRSGFKVEVIWSWGFPLGNLTHRLGRRAAAKQLEQLGPAISQEEQTTQSGMDSSALKPFKIVLNNTWLFYPFMWLQSFFYHLDWGSGYVVKARRRR